MERLGPSHLREAAPEVELVVREINRAAAFAASSLASAWDKRATAEWIDPERDEDALFAVVDLERLGESPSVELESLPFLPEVQPNWEPGRTLTGEFAELHALLPFDDDELVIVRGGLLVWNRTVTGTRPALADPELLKKWRDWLREPPDTEGIQRVSPAPLAVHTICSRLYQASKVALVGS